MELRIDENYWLGIIIDMMTMNKSQLIRLEHDLVHNHYEVYRSLFKKTITKQYTILLNE